jgi:Family of unknown function (DUF6220)
MAEHVGTGGRRLGGVATIVRMAHLVAAWAFVAAILVQVFLAGLFVFGEASYRVLHIDFGYALFFLPLAMLILAPLGRLPRRAILLDGALLLLYVIQTSLPLFRGSIVIPALHPVLALLMFGLASMIAVRARGFVPRPLGTATTWAATFP